METKVKCILCKKQMIDHDEIDVTVEPQYCLDCGHLFCNDCYFIDSMMTDEGYCPRCLYRYKRVQKENSHILTKMIAKRQKTTKENTD